MSSSRRPKARKGNCAAPELSGADNPLPYERLHLALDSIDIPAFAMRKGRDPDKFEELCESVKRLGVLQDIITRDLGTGRYRLIAGAGQRHRRRGAPRLATSGAAGRWVRGH